MKNKILIFSITLLWFGHAKAQWKLIYDMGKYASVPSLNKDENHLFLTNLIGLSMSSDSGNSWKLIDSSRNLIFAHGFIRFDSMLIAGSSDGIYQSLDSGKSWKLRGGPDLWYKGLIRSGNNLVMSDHYLDITVSKDTGKTWMHSNSGLPKRMGGPHPRELFGPVKCKENLIAISDEDIYISYNHGQSWNLKGEGYPLHPFSLYEFEHYIYSGSDYLRVSKDSGSSWKSIYTPKHGYYTGAGVYADDNHILLGLDGNGGLMISKDSGYHWRFINDGLPNMDIRSFLGLNGFFYIGLANGQAYRRSIAEMLTVTVDEPVGIKEVEKLDFKIKVIPQKGSDLFEFGSALVKGQITLFNVAGLEVMKISNINTDHCLLPYQGLAPGIYIYLLNDQGGNIARGKIFVD